MADDKAEPREVTWRSLLPWTELFRGFQIALDLNKLLLAAGGIVATAFGWWLLAAVFGASYKDNPPQPAAGSTDKAAWKDFKRERDDWNLMHRAAGVGKATDKVEPADLAESADELDKINEAKGAADKSGGGTLESELIKKEIERSKAARYARQLDTTKPYALMATWPWFEERGPNPFMLATGQVHDAWQVGQFWNWLFFDQAPVLVEPLVKFLRPIIYFFSPQASGTARFYFLCVMILTLAVWSLFGGAITRIAAVQIARNERIGMSEAVRFTWKRMVHYATAPLFPMVFVLGLLILMIIFGYFHMIPILGDIVVDGIFWWVMIGFGLLIAVALVGLVGWPLMSATISTEGTDSWEAVSRSYTYVFQRPWHYVWYSLVAICYGAAVVFFIGFMGSFMVYMSKWGVSQTFGINAANREPSYLFVYAPTSFGWRTLLLDGVVVNDEKLVQDGEIKKDLYEKYVGRDANYPKDRTDQLSWWNKVGAGLVAIWVGLLFLLVLGFGYSFFWSSATIIYLLMRKNVDTAELDEVYLEEDDQEGAYAGPLAAPTPSPATAPTAEAGGAKATQLQMVEAPSLKAPVTTPVSEAVAPGSGVTDTKPGESAAPTSPPSPNGGPEASPS
jgi:hypothetical protein